MNKSTKIKRLCLSGMLIALSVVLSAYIKIPIGESIRLDLGYAVVMIGSMFFGGVYGGVIAFISRILNDLLVKGNVNLIHVWWAIGSAFFGSVIGLVYTRFLLKLRNRRIKICILFLATICVSFIAFVGIVPPVAALITGTLYSLQLGFGVTAFVVDAIVALCIGYPLYEILIRIPNIHNFGVIKRKKE